jgi:hypothetical protein
VLNSFEFKPSILVFQLREVISIPLSRNGNKMIDFNEEALISLQEAARILPRRRAGRPVHVSCVYRWTQIGVKGIVLESVQVGGCRCTSRAALNRFFERLTQLSEAG